MQGTVLRALAAALFAISLAACHFNTRTAAGVTPAPSPSGAADTNSTAPPVQAMSKTPSVKYYAKTAGDVKGVTFSVWANGTPIGSLQWPNKALDLTSKMRGHANVLVIQWERTTKSGSGTMTIVAQGSTKPVLVAHVSAGSPAKGQVSKTIIAPQAPVGRPAPGG
ncbi:MAG TPA: hypothetical protein VFE17_09155 [Candidatus Baltobacteraceae bacterium]|jgi:hypothetical protein|nr:hypothetical protein [Candidatus Baltobacteraceae bacterium]